MKKIDKCIFCGKRKKIAIWYANLTICFDCAVHVAIVAIDKALRGGRK